MAPNPDILEQIVAAKREDLPRLKREYPIKGRTRARQRLGREAIFDALLEGRIIGEIKRASPSMGEIGMETDCLQQARSYCAGGAAMISVLTDERYFCGSFALLEQIGREVSCPLLCKDFIIDEWQIDAAALAGADCLLLIASCFGPGRSGGSEERLEELYQYALGKGLLPLVEIYSPHERYTAYQLRPDLLGVNSRDLESMELDLERGATVLNLLRSELEMPRSRAMRAQMGCRPLPIFVGESGVHSVEDAQTWQQGGADCLLVGTSLMRKHSPSPSGDCDPAQHIARLRSVFPTT